MKFSIIAIDLRIISANEHNYISYVESLPKVNIDDTLPVYIENDISFSNKGLMY